MIIAVFCFVICIALIPTAPSPALWKSKKKTSEPKKEKKEVSKHKEKDFGDYIVAGPVDLEGLIDNTGEEIDTDISFPPEFDGVDIEFDIPPGDQVRHKEIFLITIMKYEQKTVIALLKEKYATKPINDANMKALIAELVRRLEKERKGHYVALYVDNELPVFKEFLQLLIDKHKIKKAPNKQK